ncbi:MAG: DNA-binding protein WhiA [Firmicutes bacterium]|nr:DNA-binding protein WhiA [Bacillota bacterium]
MSFTSIVKNELSKLELEKIEGITELSAILKNNAIIDNNCIKVTTENSSVARHIFNIIKDVYKISPKITVRKGYNYNKNYMYILEIKDKKDLIIKDLSLDTDIPNDYILDDDNLTRIYLRGVFIACGSVNDPKKSRYHLEFMVDTKEYAEFIKDKLNLYYLNSKVIKRDNRFMIYIKEAEKIGDFLRMINAISALLYFEDIRIYRDHKNMTNRLNNCEQANVDKIIETANNQVKDIELIESIGGIDLLDEKVKIAAIYRMKYKEASLVELSEIISLETGVPITKSGLHHRFTKIKELANRIRNK